MFYILYWLLWDFIHAATAAGISCALLRMVLEVVFAAMFDFMAIAGRLEKYFTLGPFCSSDSNLGLHFSHGFAGQYLPSLALLVIF